MATGSCLCTGIKYTLTGAPASQALCHCKTCHKITGSAFTTCLIYPSTSLSLTGTSLKSFSIKHESGATFTVHFCSNCGTTIYKEGDGGFKGTVIVQAGTLDEGGLDLEGGLNGVKVGAELWVSQRAAWVKGLEGAAQLQKFE